MELNGASTCFSTDKPRYSLRRLAPRWCLAFSPPGTFVLSAILVIDVAILCLAAVSIIDSIEERVEGKASSPAAPAVVARPLPPVKKKSFILVDDFSNASLNRLGGRKERFARYGAVLEEAPVMADAAERCLRLSYDVSSPSSLCGYASELPGIDLTKFRRLRFQIKGDSVDEVFKIALGCGDAVQSKAISRLLPDGLNGEWQTVSLPLPERIDGTAPLRLTLLFEHDQGMPYSGAISLRRLRLY